MNIKTDKHNDKKMQADLPDECRCKILHLKYCQISSRSYKNMIKPSWLHSEIQICKKKKVSSILKNMLKDRKHMIISIEAQMTFDKIQ